MKWLYLAASVAACVLALSSGLPQGQQVIKGGGTDHHKIAFAAQRYKNGTNTTHVDPNRGICYQEVLTASLVKDKSHVPPGNGSKPGYSAIRTCCPGYERNPHNFNRCDPQCESGCVNAACTAPNTCTCFPDHVQNLAGFCMPTCPIGCQNGICDGDQCRCKPGYKLNYKRMFCEPLCSKNCGGHGSNCTAPDTCACNNGYVLSPSGDCRADCGECKHGECIGPGQCACFKGYTKNYKGECEPVCTRGCSSGSCIAPDTCSCAYGYELENNACVPHCSQPCLNGICSGPNVCTCNRGYYKDITDPTESRCIPHCAGGCPNGVCSDVNFCICNLGFVKDRNVKGSQVCVRRTRRSVDDGKHHLKMMVSEFED